MVKKKKEKIHNPNSQDERVPGAVRKRGES